MLHGPAYWGNLFGNLSPYAAVWSHAREIADIMWLASFIDYDPGFFDDCAGFKSILRRAHRVSGFPWRINHFPIHSGRKPEAM